MIKRKQLAILIAMAAVSSTASAEIFTRTINQNGMAGSITLDDWG